MDSPVSEFLKAIPDAASSPLTLIAYLATLAAWVFIAYRVKRFNILMNKIEYIPEDQQKEIFRLEFNDGEIPPNLTANQYMKKKRQQYIFYAFLVSCAMVLIFVGMTFYTIKEKRDRADNLYEKTFSDAASDFRSASKVLSNGPEMLKQAAAELGPPPTLAQIQDATEKLVQAGMRDGAQINNRLSQIFGGGGKIQKISEVLNKAAANLDGAYGPLADCFRKVECAAGKHFAEMCDRVKVATNNIAAINDGAGSIPGVMINTTDASPLFGNGSLDIYFDAVKAPNLAYLKSSVCV